MSMEPFIAWFQSRNGTLDTTAIGLADIPGHGRGAVALKDLPVCTRLPDECCGQEH